MLKFILLLEMEFKHLRARQSKARLMDLGTEPPCSCKKEGRGNPESFICLYIISHTNHIHLYRIPSSVF